LPTYTVTNAVTTSAGTYRVDVSNASGTVSSSAAILFQPPPGPQITQQLVGGDVTIGSNYSLKVIASGLPTLPEVSLIYAWYKLNQATGLYSIITGATTPNYDIYNFQSVNAGTYRVDVTNAAGTVSSFATLNILSVPLITTQLSNASVAFGASNTFTVAASGLNLTYTWYKDNVVLNGASNPSFTVSYADSMQAGAYKVVVTNDAGTAASSATLTVGAMSAISNSATPAPVLVTPLIDTYAATNSMVYLNAGFSGQNLTYTWFKNGILLTPVGGNSATLIISNLQASDSDTYQVVATNSGGSVSSSSVLTVSDGAALVTPINNYIGYVGSAITMSTNASGPNLSYQWFKNGSPIIGATLANLTIVAQLADDNAVYRVDINNLVNKVSETSRLSVNYNGKKLVTSAQCTGCHTIVPATTTTPVSTSIRGKTKLTLDQANSTAITGMGRYYNNPGGTIPLNDLQKQAIMDAVAGKVFP
jgi:hypothetical protein